VAAALLAVQVGVLAAGPQRAGAATDDVAGVGGAAPPDPHAADLQYLPTAATAALQLKFSVYAGAVRHLGRALYVADDDAIERIDLSAGNGQRIAGVLAGGSGAYPWDAIGQSALSVHIGGTSTAPVGFAVGPTGDVYVTVAGAGVSGTTQDLNRIYRIDHATGLLQVAAGTGTAGYSGDGGAATSAQLNARDLWVDSAGVVWFVQLNATDQPVALRRITTGGTVTTVAGNGTPWDPTPITVGSSATSVHLPDTYGMGVASDGHVYFVDGSRLLRVDASGRYELVATLPDDCQGPSFFNGAGHYDVIGNDQTTGAPELCSVDVTTGTAAVRAISGAMGAALTQTAVGTTTRSAVSQSMDALDDGSVVFTGNEERSDLQTGQRTVRVFQWDTGATPPPPPPPVPPGIPWVWGSYPLLGEGYQFQVGAPTQVVALSGVQRLSLGYSDAFAIRGDGSMATWGSNVNGREGDGTVVPHPVPVGSNLGSIRSVSAASAGTVIVRTNGTVVLAGASGQFSAFQAPLSTLTGAVDAVASNNAVYVRSTSGITAYWTDEFGAVRHDVVAGLPPGSVLAGGPSSISGAAFALGTDGSVWSLNDLSRSAPPHPTRIAGVPVAAGVDGLNGDLVSVVGRDGSLWVAANPGYGSPLSPFRVTGLPPLLEATDGLALGTDHTVWSYRVQPGAPLPVSVAQVAGISNATHVAAASGQTFGAVLADGTAQMWGVNQCSSAGDGIPCLRTSPGRLAAFTQVAGMASDGSVSLAVGLDGSVWGWGIGYSGTSGLTVTTPARLTVPRAVAVAVGHNAAAVLTADGHVWSWAPTDGIPGSSIVVPRQVPGLTDVVRIRGGSEAIAAIRRDGTLWVWGAGMDRVGGVPAGTFESPTRISGLPALSDVAFSTGSTTDLSITALGQDGTVWSWGAYGPGLGFGDSIARTSPARLSGITGAEAVAGGIRGGFALVDGAVLSWGDSTVGYGCASLGRGAAACRGRPETPAPLAGLTDIAAIGANTAVDRDGHLFRWGPGSYGSLSDGCGASLCFEYSPFLVPGLANVTSAGPTWAIADPNLAQPPSPQEQAGPTTLPAGGSASTDTEGDGATILDPVETIVRTGSSSGSVSITEAPTTIPTPVGFSLLGWSVAITAPVATAPNPISLTFTLDSSLLPAGTTTSNLQVRRNGVVVPACAGPAGQAVPTPCVAQRTGLSNGDIVLTVLTVAASHWDFGLPNPQVATTGPTETDEGSSATIGTTQPGAGALPVNVQWTVDGTTTDGPTVQIHGVDDGVITALATVVDSAGGTQQLVHEVLVRNVAPTVRFFSRKAAALNKPYALGLLIGDPGAQDLHSTTVRWGDFTSPTTTGGSSATHTYKKVGTYTITATATDDDGGTGTRTMRVSVLHTVGFLAPIKAPPTLNAVVAGHGVKLPFSLGIDAGASVVSGSPVLRRINCSTGAVTSQQTLSANRWAVRHAGAQYELDWATLASYRGSCREVRVTIIDGTVLAARFKLT
jgi:alpha-tubulin suppressor-like RCC1 family protein